MSETNGYRIPDVEEGIKKWVATVAGVIALSIIVCLAQLGSDPEIAAYLNSGLNTAVPRSEVVPGVPVRPMTDVLNQLDGSSVDPLTVTSIALIKSVPRDGGHSVQ